MTLVWSRIEVDITRGRLIQGKFLAVDCYGPTDSRTDTTATHWAEIPEFREG